MAEAYSDFATVYDNLMDNIPYDEWFTYLHSLLQEYSITDGIIAELGCGTGNITERLSKAGYDMIGIDYSPSMLDIAGQKKAENNSNTLYLCQDMREFELFGTVAAIVSICDSVNYITDPSDLLKVFRLVNNYLDTNGIFIFDFHTKYYYKEIVGDATIAEDRDTISFIWDNYYDDETDICELTLSLFIQDTDDTSLYRKHEEFHEQRGYTLAEMLSLVEQSGMTLLASYDAFTHCPATEESERVYMIAREHTTTGDKKRIADTFLNSNEA
ncbi:MAG: class I SAM-dependent methyltransferase [Eubacteriales bacterium]|nr:class I SAM-dependent methyltransferase [Eubacteriales bacterium]